jgi:hypothetical protein
VILADHDAHVAQALDLRTARSTPALIHSWIVSSRIASRSVATTWIGLRALHHSPTSFIDGTAPPFGGAVGQSLVTAIEAHATTLPTTSAVSRGHVVTVSALALGRR